MSARIWQALAFLAVVPALCAADPPSESAKKRDELHADLLKVLERLNSAPAPATPAGPKMPPVAPPNPKTDGPIVPLDGTPASVIKAGVTYFKNNDFEAARLLFAGIDTTSFPREDRAFVKYMVGCCLRRLERLPEAEIAFREVANSDDDEFHKNCAIWQLSLIKSNRELNTQLGELRARAKSK